MFKIIDDKIRYDHKEAKASIWAPSLLLYFICWIVFAFAADSVEIPSDQTAFEYLLPFLYPYWTVANFNILYLAGVTLNLTLMFIYIKKSDLDLSNHTYLGVIKQFVAFTLLGYGGVNLFIYPALALIGIGKLIFVTVTSTLEFLGDVSENGLKRLVKTLNNNKS